MKSCCRILGICLNAILLSLGLLSCASDQDPPGLVWPNQHSSANSDPWLMTHHQEIRQMRPRVLALNFVNDKSNEQMLTQLKAAAAAVAEGSRYHGYENSTSQPFLQHQISYAVDLRDRPLPAGWTLRNSTRYPRLDSSQFIFWGFDYGRLFGEEFAKLYNIEDPDQSGHQLDLCELVDKGMINEVWLYAASETIGRPWEATAEILSLKPFYDQNRSRLEMPLGRCAGNGCFEDSTVFPAHCTRSLSIAYFNVDRGPGCFLESLSHGFESMATIGGGGEDYLPYLRRHFVHFAGFDLNTRFGLPFSSWYKCPYNVPCLSYPSETSVRYQFDQFQGVIDPYDAICGNVHFPPNARAHYDQESDSPVLASCEGYQWGESPQPTDPLSRFTVDRFAPYRQMAQDCMGPWLVYWRQNFPGMDNPAHDLDGQPMLNWWPFVYY